MFRRKNVDFVFQQFRLLPELTALENVMTPLLIQKVAIKKPVNGRNTFCFMSVWRIDYPATCQTMEYGVRVSLPIFKTNLASVAGVSNFGARSYYVSKGGSMIAVQAIF